jgi:hypothetical protein
LAFDELIDKFAARLQIAGLLVGRIDDAPWIDAFETRLGRRLPPSFSSLMHRYAFLPFEWDAVRFLGNSGAHDEGDLVVAAARDSALWQATTKARFIQFARSPGVNYDPVCFDTTVRRKDRESPIVRLDHETILIKDRVVVVEQLAPSFAALLESLLANGRHPDAT